jgi:S1-C subfamily serine protease
MSRRDSGTAAAAASAASAVDAGGFGGRSGSAPLSIPAGLPKLGLEVANRRLSDGVVVLGVVSHLPAYTAGLCRGDIIVGLGGSRVTNKTDFVEALQKVTNQRPAGDRGVTVEVEYVACSIDGEFDNDKMDTVPAARKRKVIMTAATMLSG